jgi:hypothetical protein
VIGLWITFGSLAANAATLDLCPMGEDWTRERQQRPPIVESAPVLTRAVECEGKPLPKTKNGWRINYGSDECTLLCSYADGSEARVPLVGVARVSPEGRKR